MPDVVDERSEAQPALTRGRLIGLGLLSAGVLGGIVVAGNWQRFPSSRLLELSFLLTGGAAALFAQIQGVRMVVARSREGQALAPGMRLLGAGVGLVVLGSDAMILASGVLSGPMAGVIAGGAGLCGVLLWRLRRQAGIEPPAASQANGA